MIFGPAETRPRASNSTPAAPVILLELVGVRGGCPPERIMLFLRVHAGGWGRAGGLEGGSGLLLLLFVARRARPWWRCFSGVRFGRRGIQENVLLSEIYVVACSKPCDV